MILQTHESVEISIIDFLISDWDYLLRGVKSLLIMFFFLNNSINCWIDMILISSLNFNHILQRLLAFGHWEGHKCCSSSNCISQEQPWFQVKRCHKMMTGKVACQITVGCQKYCIIRISGKSAEFAFRILNKDGHIVAEVINIPSFIIYIFYMGIISYE